MFQFMILESWSIWGWSQKWCSSFVYSENWLQISQTVCSSQPSSTHDPLFQSLTLLFPLHAAICSFFPFPSVPNKFIHLNPLVLEEYVCFIKNQLFSWKCSSLYKPASYFDRSQWSGNSDAGCPGKTMLSIHKFLGNFLLN